VLTAIGNSGDAGLADEAQRLLDDESPLVRGAAVWALSRLLPRAELVALAASHATMTTHGARGVGGGAAVLILVQQAGVPRTRRSTKWCAAEPGPLRRRCLLRACDGPGSAPHR